MAEIIGAVLLVVAVLVTGVVWCCLRSGAEDEDGHMAKKEAAE